MNKNIEDFNSDAVDKYSNKINIHTRRIILQIANKLNANIEHIEKTRSNLQSNLIICKLCLPDIKIFLHIDCTGILNKPQISKNQTFKNTYDILCTNSIGINEVNEIATSINMLLVHT